MADDFLLEEYKMLRTKSQDIIRRVEDLERNVVIACSAIFVFSVGTFKPEYKWQSLILFILPLCVSLVGFVRYKGLAFYARDVNKYTVIVEEKLAGKQGGWLTYYYSPDRQHTDKYYQRYRSSIWYAIILFNALAGLVLARPLFRG
jgi:hypothetical protein